MSHKILGTCFVRKILDQQNFGIIFPRIPSENHKMWGCFSLDAAMTSLAAKWKSPEFWRKKTSNPVPSSLSSLSFGFCWGFKYLLGSYFRTPSKRYLRHCRYRSLWLQAIYLADSALIQVNTWYGAYPSWRVGVLTSILIPINYSHKQIMYT